MLKMDLIPYLLKTEPKKTSSAEKSLLEIKISIHLFKELCKFYTRRYITYLNLIKSQSIQELHMMQVNLIKEMINDILLTEDYSLSGIATLIREPQEVLADVVSGINLHPTFELAIKIFELHVMVKREIYECMLEKMISDYLSPSTSLIKEQVYSF